VEGNGSGLILRFYPILCVYGLWKITQASLRTHILRTAVSTRDLPFRMWNANHLCVLKLVPQIGQWRMFLFQQLLPVRKHGDYVPSWRHLFNSEVYTRFFIDGCTICTVPLQPASFAYAHVTLTKVRTGKRLRELNQVLRAQQFFRPRRLFDPLSKETLKGKKDQALKRAQLS
jgi:hypothetical protein